MRCASRTGNSETGLNITFFRINCQDFPMENIKRIISKTIDIDDNKIVKRHKEDKKTLTGFCLSFAFICCLFYLCYLANKMSLSWNVER